MSQNNLEGYKMQKEILDIIKNQKLEQYQKVISLARIAENNLDVLDLNIKEKNMLEKGIVCDLSEGNAPYRPRYNLVDFEKFMQQGSSFLDLKPPRNLSEAINSLLILYKHVPSVTTFPVYIGNIDMILNPFIEDEKEALLLIKLFLTHIDRTLPDSFVHANIGPEATKAGKLILQAEKELQNPIPNLSLKYSPNITSDEFALAAIKTGLEVSKPYFANHEMYLNDFGENYGLASCYNGLPSGGGSFTLVRLNLKALAESVDSQEEFFESKLSEAIRIMNSIMDKRISFLVEKSNFFESNFLVKEGLLKLERYSAMFGIFGLAEAVNYFMDKEDSEFRYGQDEVANDLGRDIIKKISNIVNQHENKYCSVSDHKFLLHAQSGIGSDEGTTPGCRIPIGEEPTMYKHIKQAGKYHSYFPAGVSDIFTFDSKNRKNPLAVLDIIKGAMQTGLRMFAFYTADNELIRITGYLVKRSEIENFKEGKVVLRDTTALGVETLENQDLYKRKKR